MTPASQRVIAELRAEEETAYRLYTAARDVRLRAMQLETALGTPDLKDDLTAAERLTSARAALEEVRRPGAARLREEAAEILPRAREALRFQWMRPERRELFRRVTELLERAVAV